MTPLYSDVCSVIKKLVQTMKEPDEAHAIVQPHQAFQMMLTWLPSSSIRSMNSAAINFFSSKTE